MLIVIEGLDGSGKATQSKLLTETLMERGYKVKQVSFPDYESNSSALVKMYLNGEFGLRPDDVNAYAASSFYAVDRYASFKKNWEMDWKSGIVIADRYTTSNAVHQCNKLNKSEWDRYLDWLFCYEYELLHIPSPDLVIYLRVETEISQRLLNERYHGREENKDIHERDVAYLKRCQEAADYCAERFDWKIVKSSSDNQMKSIEDIQSEILSIFDGLKGNIKR